jgi:hypothetical protein
MRNLLQAAYSLPWDDPPVDWPARLVLLTFTYPQEFPADGRAVKRHKKLWQQRFDHRWGRLVGLWAYEFQVRGAPHIHFYVYMPRDQELEAWPARGWANPSDERWVWASEVWAEIVGEGSERHRLLGVHVRRALYGGGRRNAGYIADYLAKHSVKWTQKEVPEGFGHVGRMWGYVGW